jgi:hypothetical protein
MDRLRGDTDMNAFTRSLAAVAVALPLATAAEATVAAAEGPVEVRVPVGGLALICQTGTIICPAAAPICDDPRVAIPELTPADGLAFKGVGPGETLCSAQSGMRIRRVYRVIVTR